MVKSVLRSSFVASVAMVGLSHAALADGSNAPRVHTAGPSPLNVHSSASTPTIHYSDASSAGVKIYSSACGSTDTEVCSGQFVSTGRVVLSGQAPAYVESVQPIIHRSSPSQVMPSQAITSHKVVKSHQSCECSSCQGHSRQQINLDGNFTGGVGAGVSSNWGGGRGGFLSVESPMVRSRHSATYYPYSSYLPRNRSYRVNKRRG